MLAKHDVAVRIGMVLLPGLLYAMPAASEGDREFQPRTEPDRPIETAASARGAPATDRCRYSEGPTEKRGGYRARKAGSRAGRQAAHLPELLRATVVAVSVRIAPRNPSKFRSEFPFALGLTFVGNIASTPKSKELIMKLSKLSMLSAVARGRHVPGIGAIESGTQRIGRWEQLTRRVSAGTR